MSLLETLAGARMFDLGQPLAQGMPHSPNHPPYMMALTRRHGDRLREDGSSGSSELLILSGHTGTHIDGLAHIAAGGLLHGGYDAASAAQGGQYTVHGIDGVAPIVARAILLDIAGLQGGGVLPASFRITARILEDAASAEGVDVRAGDAVFVHTGWAARHWHDSEAFVGRESGVPGVDESGAEWLAARKIRLTGSDTMAYEWLAPSAGHSRLPVHNRLIPAAGIHIVEMLRLEELAAARVYTSVLVLAPLPLVGATGSPVRPLVFAE